MQRTRLASDDGFDYMLKVRPGGSITGKFLFVSLKNSGMEMVLINDKISTELELGDRALAGPGRKVLQMFLACGMMRCLQCCLSARFRNRLA